MQNAPVLHGQDHHWGRSDEIKGHGWGYAEPVAPAPTPDDYYATFEHLGVTHANDANADFLNGWANVVLPDSSYSPLRWRRSVAGRVELVGAIDGGALGTVCVVLPEPFWPATDVTVPVTSADGTRAMSVAISASTGEVTVVGIVGAGTISEENISLSDVTTDDVTSSAHGFAPKSPADATKFLNGATTPAYAQVKDSDLSTSDITTNNASTSKHGFLPKLDNNGLHFLDGTGAWSTPGGLGGVLTQSYIGYNTAGGTTDAIGNGAYKQIAKSVTLAAAAQLLSIDVYVKGDASHVHNLIAAVFDDNSGAPGKIIAYVGGAETNASTPILGVAFNTTARWVSLPMSMYLPAATYWLFVSGGNNLTYHYDSSGSDVTSTSTVTWINEGTSMSNSSRKYSIRGSLLS